MVAQLATLLGKAAPYMPSETLTPFQSVSVHGCGLRLGGEPEAGMLEKREHACLACAGRPGAQPSEQLHNASALLL